MANIKPGLAYYTVDTDRYLDIRIKRLKKSYGCDGIAVYDYLLCEIYRDRGYFFEWGENSAFDVAEYFGLKETKVKGIVEFCASVGLFDKVLLSSGVLTSASIQRRYVTMCNRAKRKEISIREEFNLLKLTEESPKLTEESPKLTEESPKLTEVCDKVKKSKVKRERDNAHTREKILQDCPFILELYDDEEWTEVMCMKYPLRPPEIKEWLYQFALHVRCSGSSHPNRQATQSHFSSWLTIQIEKLNKQSNNKANANNKTGRRSIAPGEVKDYGSSF